MPTTTLSGLIKSLIASPSLKNSGFETTSTSFFFFNIEKMFSIMSPVETGTVDLVSIILYFLINFLISLAALNTYRRSAELVFFLVGVPTHIKIMSDLVTASFKLSVKFILFCLKFLFNISSRPGS